MSEPKPVEAWTFKQWCKAVGFYDPSLSDAEHYRCFVDLVTQLPSELADEVKISSDKFQRWLKDRPIQQRAEALCAIGALQRVAQKNRRIILNGINFVEHSRVFLRSTKVCAQPFADLSLREVEMLLANGPRQPELTHEIIRRELYQYVFPSPYYPIIGRERDMSELIDRLINQKLPVVCVVGTVGDGKTELVWHVVCRAVDEGHFSAFDWVADRSMYIDSNGNPRPTGLPPLTTSAIYNSMVRHFAWDDLKLCVTDLAERCAKRFREGHYCLVLDNMETQEQLERFLRELSLLVQPNPPRTSRILVTSRVQVSAPFVDYMPLRGLEREAAIEYIKHIESRSQGIVISSTDRELLAERTGGNPLFIQIALARYAKNGRNMRQVVDQMRQGSGFFATFQNLFGELYQALSDAAKRVALSAAHYTEEITRDDLEADAAHYLADLDLFEQALTELAAQHVLKPSEVVGCYTIHPLMRAYLVQILRRDAD